MARLACAAAMVALLALGACAWPEPGDPLDPGRRAESGVGRPVLGLVWKKVVHDRGGGTRPQEFAGAAYGGDVIYVGSGGGMFYALDTRDGLERWRSPVGATSTVPLLLDGKIYLGTDDGSLVCLDAGTGKELWRYATRGAIWHPPVVWGELILFANDADHVYALERATGKWRWQYERETPEEYTVRGHGGVAVAGDRVYAGFADGNLVALAAASGDPVWVRSLAASETQFVDVDTTPVVDGEIIYVASASGGVWAIDAKDGSERWRAPITGASGIAMDGGRLYVTAADEGIHALDLAGHVIWRQGLRGAGDPSEPIISGEYLFFGAASAGLFVVEKRSGKLVQQFNPGFGVSAAPTLGGGRLFVLSNGGVLYAMSVERF